MAKNKPPRALVLSLSLSLSNFVGVTIEKHSCLLRLRERERMRDVLGKILVFLCCLAEGCSVGALVSAREVPTSSGHGAAMPGFLYTRNVGRCTPQFWSSGRESWPNMIPQDSSVSKVFGSRLLERYEPGLTVLEATQRNDDTGDNVFAKLVKQSSAALLNSYARPGFPYSAWEIKSLVLEALISEEAAELQAEQFKHANQACD